MTTLAEILPAAARTHTDRIALIVEDRQFSFRELDALSNRVANGLGAIGVNPGDRVSLFGPNSWEWMVSYYGIVKTGAVVNPLSSMLTPEEVSYSMTDAGARAVLASSDKASTLPLKGVGNLTDVVLWGEAPIEWAAMLSDWLQHASADYAAARSKPSDLAVICYTSGTTGRPKGAMQSQRSVVGAAVGTALMAARTADDRIVTALPLFHVYGSSVFNAAMIAGSTLKRVLCMHAAVALAAVGSVPDEAKGELAKAYVILKPGVEVSGADLVSHCREHLAAYKVPRAVQFVASVPTTSSGKIMRRRLNEVDDGSFAVN
ncbi:MAG: AMP-binding protein [Cytophagaceae bacterium]|nr:AMP-binding protein [Gemmatimonadaceae bacterium]